MTKRIAIVGGGIAGIYTAWRLLQQNVANREQGEADAETGEGVSFVIHLYEKEDQLGGRIRSQLIPGTDFSAELGAMRFRQSHRLLNALLTELNIATRQFDLASPAYYVRGRRLTSVEITAGRCDSCHAESPFHLRDSEHGKSAVQLISDAIDRILRALNFPDLDQGEARQLKRRIRGRFFNTKTWDKIKEHGTYQGLPLYSIGFWNLLQHFLSNEAYVMVHEVLSLESIISNWNAAEAIPWFIADFASDQFDMVPGGLSLVAQKLEKSIKDTLDESKNLEGCIELRTGYAVRKVNLEGGSWTVTYNKFKKDDEGKIQRDSSDKEIVEEAKEEPGYDYVILALPQRALVDDKLLLLRRDGKPYEKRNEQGEVIEKWPLKWMNWVKGHPMLKIFLLYEEPWWMGDNLPGHDNGRVFTDLPLRQIYYFSPSWLKKHGKQDEEGEGAERQEKQEDELDEQEARKERKGLSLIMASYSDEHYVSFWEPMLKSNPELKLEVNSGPPYLHRPMDTTKITDEVWKKVPIENAEVLAKRRMVEKVQQLLTEIHGREIPQPILGVARAWDAGWHTWMIGSKPWDQEIRRQRVEPLPDFFPGLYLCGEAYSTEHGWIEGALKSAEQVLEELQVKPVWLKGLLKQDLSDYIKS